MDKTHTVSHHPLEKFQVARDHRQKAIKIVRDAARELSNRFEALRLTQHVLDAFTLSDLATEFRIGFGKLVRSLRDPKFERFVEELQRLLSGASVGMCLRLGQNPGDDVRKASEFLLDDTV